MIIDLIKAIAFAGIPIAIFSYYLVVLTSSKVKLKSNNAKELKGELKNLKIKKDKSDNYFKHAIQKKFMVFGAGFYGVVAFITYIHIEVYQIIDFIKNFNGWQNFVDSIGFGMLISFFIDAIMNLVSAFIWPIYWFKYLPIGSFWLWLTVAILAHMIAIKISLSKLDKRQDFNL